MREDELTTQRLLLELIKLEGEVIISVTALHGSIHGRGSWATCPKKPCIDVRDVIFKELR